MVVSLSMRWAGTLAVFCVTSTILSSSPFAVALSVSFPPSGTPTADFDSQMMTWQRAKSDPNAEFVIQKIKLDDGDGPSPKSTPVPIPNSSGSGGTCPMQFNRAGLFQILAVNIQNEQTFFSTEVTVLPNPTSSGAHAPSSRSSTTTSESTIALNSATPTAPISPSLAPVSSSGSPNSDANPKNYPTAIIGGVVGGVVILFSISAALLYIRHRKRHSASPPPAVAQNPLIPNPFISPRRKEIADRVDQPLSRKMPSGFSKSQRLATVETDAVEEGRTPVRDAPARTTTRVVRHGWRYRDGSPSTGDETVEDIPPDYSVV